jgi:NAD-dependent SIR2 family protein deacetylase
MVLPVLQLRPARPYLVRRNAIPSSESESADNRVVYVQECGNTSGSGSDGGSGSDSSDATCPVIDIGSASGRGPLKVVVEGCSVGTRVVLRNAPISGVVEIINSRGVVLDLSLADRNVPTIVVENSQECVVRVPDGWGQLRGQGLLYTAQCDNVVLETEGGQKFPVVVNSNGEDDVAKQGTGNDKDSDKENGTDSDSDSNNDKDADRIAQFVSRFMERGDLVTERVVREGVGYATTAREKEAADARDSEVDAKFEAMVARTVEDHLSALVRPKEEVETADTESENSGAAATPAAGLLAEISDFNKRSLRPAETVETHATVVGHGHGHGHGGERDNRGAFTGHTRDEEIEEHFDDGDVVATKVRALAARIRASKHVVVYTGAGISTSAKIPDYRGPNGVWTLREKGLRPQMDITLEQALPTPAHMALVALQRAGLVRCVVSTNVDGLHRRSGLAPTELAELHGNCYIETCEMCHREYLRTFDVTALRARPSPQHYTGRTCDVNGCTGKLRDSIINFGENLPDDQVNMAQEHAAAQDVALVLGTSMRVQPAASFPDAVRANGGALVICNLQVTPFDKYATSVIRTRTDNLMGLLCEELGVAVPEYDAENDGIRG